MYTEGAQKKKGSIMTSTKDSTVQDKGTNIMSVFKILIDGNRVTIVYDDSLNR